MSLEEKTNQLIKHSRGQVLEPINDTVAKICALDRDNGGAVQVVTVNGEERIQLWRNLYKKP